MNTLQTTGTMTTKAIASILLFTFAISAHASTLLVDTGPLPDLGTRIPNTTYWGNSALITVGENPVTIDQFGLYGQQLADGNIRFNIFDATDATFVGGTPQSPLPRVYDSGSIATPGSESLNWYLSPTFNLLLNAHSSYYFGLISDQEFTYTSLIPAPARDLGHGLIAPASDGAIRGINGNYSNFDDPAFFRTAWAQMAVQVYGTPAVVPVPAAIWLLGSALAGMSVIGRRRDKSAAQMATQQCS